MAAKSKEILISSDVFETRVAVLENRETVELYIERAESRSIAGNIYLGRVRDILPGMQAAFIDIGLEKNAFLYVEEVIGLEDVERPARKIEKVLKQGQALLVQVTKEPMGTKGARVTSQVTVPGRFLVLMPFTEFFGTSRRLDDEERARLKSIAGEIRPQGVGLIVRTAAEGATEAQLREDMEYLKRVWKSIENKRKRAQPPAALYIEADLAVKTVRDMFGEEFKQLVIDSKDTFDRVTDFLDKTAPALKGRVKLHKAAAPLFEKHGVEKAIQTALKRKVWLRSGGYLTIEHTEALTAIDVNTGKFVGKTSLEDTIFKTNIEATKEIVRQLRLRDIGGIIVIDFIDMTESSHREEVFRVFSEALEEDKTKTRVIEISRIGMVEMTRKNVTEGLLQFLEEPCPCCDGLGEVLSGTTLAIGAYREMTRLVSGNDDEAFIFFVSEPVYEFAQANSQYLRKVQRALGRAIFLAPEPDVVDYEVRVAEQGTKKEVRRLVRLYGPAAGAKPERS